MRIAPSFIQDLLARCDVVDIVGQHVELKKTGANYQGLCPFHNEKTPSFSVSPSKQFYHCFGCGKNGDAIRFLMEFQGLGFIEAVKQLAAHVGMPVPEDTTPTAHTSPHISKTQAQHLGAVLQHAAQYWQTQLKASDLAKDYLKQRGLSGAIAKHYGLGFAPAAWRGLENAFSDYPSQSLVEAGLVIEREKKTNTSDSAPEQTSDAAHRYYDRFRERIMFPIRNVAGAYIGFGGRILHKGEPKYLNSPETPVFNKGSELYGLFEARASLSKVGYALVTEGYMDVVALAQHGFTNTVATLGTACTSEHVHKLFRFTEKIVFAFDGDAAGQNAARKALQTTLAHASDKRSIHFLFLPAAHDPDSYVRAFGSDAFERLIAAALPLSQMLMRVAREGCNLDTVEGRARLATQAQPLWVLLPDGVAKRQILREIAQLAQLGERELLELWDTQKTISGGSRQPRQSSILRSRALTSITGRHAPTSRMERALGILFANTAFWDTLGMQERTMLLHWDAPIGPLFAWLERHMLERGVQAWSVLRPALEGYASTQDYRMLSRAVASAGLDEESERTELRGILLLLREDHLKALVKKLEPEIMLDPQKYEAFVRLQKEYRYLREERKQLLGW